MLLGLVFSEGRISGYAFLIVVGSDSKRRPSATATVLHSRSVVTYNGL